MPEKSAGAHCRPLPDFAVAQPLKSQGMRLEAIGRVSPEPSLEPDWGRFMVNSGIKPQTRRCIYPLYGGAGGGDGIRTHDTVLAV
jgi:hypothetical protein